MNLSFPKYVDKYLRHIRIELFSFLFSYDPKGFFHRHQFLITTFGCHGIKRICHAQNPRSQWNIFSCDPAWISFSIIPLMMTDDCRNYIIQRWKVTDNIDRCLYMPFDDLIFFICQFSLFIEYILRNTDFTDIISKTWIPFFPLCFT